MPIYMDVHSVPGVKARDVAIAHQHDLAHEQEFNCKCMTYWVDETRETIFCLMEAPHEKAVKELHQKAHGLIPYKVIEVNSTLVESFLGRIYDPEQSGDVLIEESSFRALLVTRTEDIVLLKHQLGTGISQSLLSRHNQLIRQCIHDHQGRESQNSGTGFIASFTSAKNAMDCAEAILDKMEEETTSLLGFRVSLHGGEPVGESNQLFGDSIELAQCLCSVGKPGRINLSSQLRPYISVELMEKPGLSFSLTPLDEQILQQLYQQLDLHYSEAEFDVLDYAQAMAMSQSQLYRKTIALTGHSPNVLLREFRLQKALELMQRQYYSITQITFDSGFTSPSYFTKCFKKKFGLLPMQYIELLD